VRKNPGHQHNDDFRGSDPAGGSPSGEVDGGNTPKVPCGVENASLLLRRLEKS
jgi:hypothetical protein